MNDKQTLEVFSSMPVPKGLIYIPALFILKACLGVTGLIWAQPVADLLSLGIAAALYFKAAKRMMQVSGAQVKLRLDGKIAEA